MEVNILSQAVGLNALTDFFFFFGYTLLTLNSNSDLLIAHSAEKTSMDEGVIAVVKTLMINKLVVLVSYKLHVWNHTSVS